jgi:hypothetical protein
VWFNTSQNLVIPNTTITQQNTYTGGVFQQATSGLTTTGKLRFLLSVVTPWLTSVPDQDCYELTTGCFSIYGIEYKPGFDNAVSMSTSALCYIMLTSPSTFLGFPLES